MGDGLAGVAGDVVAAGGLAGVVLAAGGLAGAVVASPVGVAFSPPPPPSPLQAATVKAKPNPKAKVTIFLFIHSSFTDCSQYNLLDDDNNTSFARLAGK